MIFSLLDYSLQTLLDVLIVKNKNITSWIVLQPVTVKVEPSLSLYFNKLLTSYFKGEGWIR